ncbi:hypothetical protein ACWDSJ_37015 [Nocardia sp. NPDC003482]|uniref:hypothetical protein n=1 Tax=Nocardia sp. NPDC004068 TaxID=3364303 RepID=UPI0036949EA8
MLLSNAVSTATVWRRAKRVAFVVSAAGALGLGAAHTASAAPTNLFTNLHDCQVAGGQAVAAAGGPSRLQYVCDMVNNVPAGTMGCPVNPETQKYGCLVEYYHLRTWHT